MSFLNSPQYASITTRLLTIMDSAMPRRHRIIVGAIVVGLTILSIAGSVSSRPVVQPLAPAIIVATPHVTRSTRPAKQPAPREAPQAALAAATALPQPTEVLIEVDQVQISSPGHVGERPSDKAPPVR